MATGPALPAHCVLALSMAAPLPGRFTHTSMEHSSSLHSSLDWPSSPQGLPPLSSGGNLAYKLLLTQSSMATGLFNGPFHTENSPYISFKTFYSIIYTFKIICNCPSCHILPPFPHCGVCGQLINVVCWKNRRPQDTSRGAGSNSNQQPFCIPFTFPMLSGSGGSQQEVKACEPFTFGSEV